MIHGLTSSIKKVYTRVQRNGPYVAFRYYLDVLTHAAHYLSYDRRWDRLDACRTSGAVTPNAADVVGEVTSLEEARYQAMARLPLIWAIKALDIDCQQFGFIDYGSGRGRLLLAAGRFPFRRILGVEFSRPLHEQACENIRSYPKTHLASTDIQSVHANALEFDLPEGDWIAFMFNPASEDAIERIAQRIRSSCEESPRTVFLVFANSDRLGVLQQLAGFIRLRPRGVYAQLLRAFASAPFEFYSVEGGKPALSRSWYKVPRQLEVKRSTRADDSGILHATTRIVHYVATGLPDVLKVWLQGPTWPQLHRVADLDR